MWEWDVSMVVSDSLQSQIQHKQPLIILGMHRSGTSLIVRLLTDLGIHMGSWLSRDAESVHFLGLNKRILESANSSWADIDGIIKQIESNDFISVQSTELTKSLFQEKLSDFRKHFNPLLQVEVVRLGWMDNRKFVSQNELIAIFFGEQYWEQVLLEQSFSWGWKDPRTTLTFPIWLEIFPNARFLNVIRNGIDVAISMHRRSLKQKEKIWNRVYPIDYSPETLDFGYCFHLWEEYNSFVIDHKHLIPAGQYQEIQYEDLLDSPEAVLRRIATYAEHSTSAEKIAAACRRIDRTRLDNSEFAKPYQELIPSLANKPLMEKMGYGYSL